VHQDHTSPAGALSNTKASTLPGPDGWTIDHLKALGTLKLVWAFSGDLFFFFFLTWGNKFLPSSAQTNGSVRLISERPKLQIARCTTLSLVSFSASVTVADLPVEFFFLFYFFFLFFIFFSSFAYYRRKRWSNPNDFKIFMLWNCEIYNFVSY